MTTKASDPGQGESSIFVSYARADTRIVLPIVERLRGEDLPIWIDLEGIEGASFWRKEIVEAIERSRVVLFFASKGSCASENISKELALANEDRKAILPVLLESVVLPSDLRYQLAGLQRIEWYRDKEGAYGQMLLALRRLMNPADTEAAKSVQPPRSRVTGRSTRRNVLLGSSTTLILGGSAGLWQWWRTKGRDAAPSASRDVDANQAMPSKRPAGGSYPVSLRAVVIGNQNYVLPQNRLKNCIADAKAVGQFIQQQRFKVTELFDLTTAETRDRLSEFYTQSSLPRTRNLVASPQKTPPSVYFFFYSGHALSLDGRLCIVPVDAESSSEAAARRYVIPIEALLASNYGIRPRNQLTLYAAAPGQLAYDSGVGTESNSPFTEAFLRHLQNATLDVATLFAYVTRDVRRKTSDAQTPWVEGSLDAPLFLGDFGRTNLEGDTLISVIDACRNSPFAVNK